MSKRRILLTIDANEKTCGRCQLFSHNSGPTGYCEMWGAPEDYAERIPECLEAEKLAKGGKR